MRSIVRRTCEDFVSGPDCKAMIIPSQIDPFLKAIDASEYKHILKRTQAKLNFPLIFDLESQKQNFYALLHLLNFGSGYRTCLKASNGSGAFDTLTKLMISFHLTTQRLDAAWMKTVDSVTVGERMQVVMTVDVPVPGSSDLLKEVKPSSASQLVTKVVSALHTTASAIEEAGESDLIGFIETAISQSKDVDDLLRWLARVPTLRDQFTVNGMEVCVYKKSQVMLSELLRQGVEVPCLAPGDLTIFSDNVIPTMLHHHGLISCPSADSALATDAQITPEESVSLRAASVVVCEAIVQRAKELEGYDWIGDEVALDNYLWKVAKEPEFRRLPRYSDRDTWFF